MTRLINFFFIFFCVLTSFSCFGQKSDTAKLNNLVVYGDGFVFGVTEPDSWHGDIDDAKQYSANIIFYKSKIDLENGGTIIQVLSFGKQDEKTEEDLKYDIKGYKDKFKDLKEHDFSASHKEYKCFSRLVCVDGEFYQYTVYINPGIKFKIGLSVSMNIQKRAASDIELKAFRAIISSLVMLKG